MWSVKAPSVTVADAATACARGVRDKALERRVLAAVGSMSGNNTTYQIAIHGHQLHTVTSSTYTVPGIGDEEMVALYTRQMAKTGRPGRPIYNRLRSAARHGLCSYCQYGQAQTLDHFIPKSSVAALAIDPWNLVPCCRDCNAHLMADHSSDPSKQMLHPYDLPAIGRWLYATAVHGTPVSLRFHANPDPYLSRELRARVTHQFEVLALGRLYAVASAPEVTETGRTLSRFFTAAHAADVRDHLRGLSDDAFGEAENSNTRRGALLEALADDDWYCSEGFLT